MKKITLILGVFLLMVKSIYCQTFVFSSKNIHSHNNYQQPIPLYDAIENKVGSIEIDVLLWNDTLWVGHDFVDIKKKNTLLNQYIIPIDSIIKKRKNVLYDNSNENLQILIDIKTNAEKTIEKIIQLLNTYKNINNNSQISIVITGNQPPHKIWKNYPKYIQFDGQLNQNYDSIALSRIPLFSGDLSKYTKWNGKGIMIKEDKKRIDSIIKTIHAKNKKIRFWNAPDNLNSWIQLMNCEVDFINTDNVGLLANFLKKQVYNTAKTKDIHQVNNIDRTENSANKKAKNIILIIGDGMGLAHIHAGYITNHEKLNLYQFKNIGLSITHSADAFNTDSAPGATSIASGKKTNNRYVGVDTSGFPLETISSIFKNKGKNIGIISSGDITDATPAAFYAHEIERENSASIFKSLLNANLDYVAGSGAYNYDTMKFNQIHLSKQGGLSIENGRGAWLSNQLNVFLNKYSKNDSGFFVMLEGAQIDYGGHANSLQYIVNEINDLDDLVGQALAFAKNNTETLVIVTSDHETGGLTLVEGNVSKGNLIGQFSTNDHTALPVLVFAYGPQSTLFNGIYQNNELFNKMLQATSND